MIYEEDAKDFSEMLDAVWGSYGRNQPEKAMKRYWFEKLMKYPLGDVGKAFDRYVSSNRELPQIIDIDKLCKPAHFSITHEPVTIDFEKSKENASNVKKMIESKRTGTNKGKDWADKILANPQNYKAIAISFAKKAKGIQNDEREDGESIFE